MEATMDIVRDDIWLCPDCMQVAVNGHCDDLSHERDNAVTKGIERLGPGLVPDFTEEHGDGHDEFSWRPCWCCETKLGGSRWRFAVLGEEVVQ